MLIKHECAIFLIVVLFVACNDRSSSREKQIDHLFGETLDRLGRHFRLRDAGDTKVQKDAGGTKVNNTEGIDGGVRRHRTRILKAKDDSRSITLKPCEGDYKTTIDKDIIVNSCKSFGRYVLGQRQLEKEQSKTRRNHVNTKSKRILLWRYPDIDAIACFVSKGTSHETISKNGEQLLALHSGLDDIGNRHIVRTKLSSSAKRLQFQQLDIPVPSSPVKLKCFNNCNVISVCSSLTCTVYRVEKEQTTMLFKKRAKDSIGLYANFIEAVNNEGGLLWALGSELLLFKPESGLYYREEVVYNFSRGRVLDFAYVSDTDRAIVVSEDGSIQVLSNVVGGSKVNVAEHSLPSAYQYTEAEIVFYKLNSAVIATVPMSGLLVAYNIKKKVYRIFDGYGQCKICAYGGGAMLACLNRNAVVFYSAITQEILADPREKIPKGSKSRVVAP